MMHVICAMLANFELQTSMGIVFSDCDSFSESNERRLMREVIDDFNIYQTSIILNR